MERLPPFATEVARVIELLDAVPGVTVERASRERGEWTIRAACDTRAAHAAAMEALRGAWPPGARQGALRVRFRVG